MHALSDLTREATVGYEEELDRKAQALRAIYRTDGLNLSEHEARAIAHQMRRKLFWQTVLGIIFILGIVAFLIVRFVL